MTTERARVADMKPDSPGLVPTVTAEVVRASVAKRNSDRPRLTVAMI